MNNLNRSIANKVFVLRNRYGLTQEEFAKSLNISRGHLSKIENGQITPSAEFVKLLCSRFNVSADWLLDIPLPSEENSKDLSLSQAALSLAIKFDSLDSNSKNIISELMKIISKS